MTSVIKYSPKEKAIELVDKYYKSFDLELDYLQSKQCVLIAVEEILKYDIEARYLNKQSRGYTIYTHTSFWKEVINEIEKL